MSYIQDNPMVSLRLPADVLAQAEDLARQEGISRSELIRRGIVLAVSAKRADR